MRQIRYFERIPDCRIDWPLIRYPTESSLADVFIEITSGSGTVTRTTQLCKES